MCTAAYLRMHGYITAMPEHEFVLWVIGAHAADRGKFVYELPGNVVEVHEVFLDDALRLSGEQHEASFNDREREALRRTVSLSIRIGMFCSISSTAVACIRSLFAEPHVYGYLSRRVHGRVSLHALCRCIPHHALHVAARALPVGQRGAGGRCVPRYLDRLRWPARLHRAQAFTMRRCC